MSPNINSFVGDLVEMAKAFEELPGVRKELEQANQMMLEQGDVIASREERILSLKSEIETLHATTRRLEAERDDAEMRFLELEETSTMVRRVLNDISDSARNQARQITATIEKPTPFEELPNPIAPTAQPSEGPSSEAAPQAIGSGEALSNNDGWDHHPKPQGQSESPLLAPTNETGSAVHSESVGMDNSVPEKPTSANGPYSGKRYIDVRGYISLVDWLNGGGTEADYHLPF